MKKITMARNKENTSVFIFIHFRFHNSSKFIMYLFISFYQIDKCLTKLKLAK